MKKLFSGIFAMLLFYSISFSQYCGHSGNPSGPSQCSFAWHNYSGFTHNEDIDCITRGQLSNTTLQFRYFDSVTINGNLVTTDWLRIDSIGNLPAGLCWASSIANNTFQYFDSTCLNIQGVATSPPGQYKLNVYVTVKVQNVTTPVALNGDELGIKILLRVIEPSFTFCPPVDQSQTTPYTDFDGNYENLVQVSGRVYYDNNHNSILDAGDFGAQGKTVIVGGSYVAFTNAAGIYNVIVPAGTHVVKPVKEAVMIYTPDSIILNAPTAGATYANNDFAITVASGYCDGQLSIVSQNPPPRPGFNHAVQVNFFNVISANAINGTLKLTYNTNEVYVSSTVTPSLVDTVARYITWAMNGIGQQQNFLAGITFYTPPAVAIGALHTYTADIINANCDNMDSLSTTHEITVVGSYDPNDKTVSPAGFGTDGRIIPGTSPLTYTIRFQNTGNYEAENVRVVDTLSELVNIASFKLIGSSHPCEVIVNGRVITFVFTGIHLADSNTNEAMSHGYIQYSINPNDGFVNNTVIENLADIYFDFNAPIRTNTAKTTGDINASINAVTSNVLQFSIYPNPNAGDILQLVVDPQLTGKNADLMDVNGKLISRTRINAVNTTIAVKDLSAGVYLVKVEGAVKRLIIE